MLGRGKGGALYVGAAAIVVAALAIYAMALVNAKLSAADRRARAQSQEVTDLAQQVALMQDALRARAADAPGMPVRLVEPAGTAPPPPIKRPDDGAPSPVGSSGLPGATPEEVRDSVEAKFLGEGQDPAWSRTAGYRARSTVLRSLPSESRLSGIECRASMCRVETTHPNESAYQQFMRAPMRSLENAWPAPSLVTVLRTEPDGEVVSVMYLAREGSGPLVPE
jgi:hypothetical protein